MGRKSTKENKNIYQQIRDELNMTRSDVSDKTDGVLSESRLEKIENGNMNARPEDVIMMADIIDRNCAIITAPKNVK